MAVEQLPRGVREFAGYLDGLLARLDPGGGWSGVFWRRDPDGMRASLDGREVPPWDVVEALLEDLAGAYGPAAAAAERERARTLHGAALTAYDARPGARDTLADRLDVMLREQRYAAERRAELTRLLSTPPSAAEAAALRLDLAWAHDDHERATARCEELRFRLAELNRRGAVSAEAVRTETAGGGGARQGAVRAGGVSAEAAGAGGGRAGAVGSAGVGEEALRAGGVPSGVVGAEASRAGGASAGAGPHGGGRGAAWFGSEAPEASGQGAPAEASGRSQGTGIDRAARPPEPASGYAFPHGEPADNSASPESWPTGGVTGESRRAAEDFLPPRATAGHPVPAQAPMASDVIAASAEIPHPMAPAPAQRADAPAPRTAAPLPAPHSFTPAPTPHAPTPVPDAARVRSASSGAAASAPTRHPIAPAPAQRADAPAPRTAAPASTPHPFTPAHTPHAPTPVPDAARVPSASSGASAPARPGHPIAPSPTRRADTPAPAPRTAPPSPAPNTVAPAPAHTPHAPSPVLPVSVTEDVPSAVPGKPRKRRRGSARFAGMAEEGGGPVVVPQDAPSGGPAGRPARRTPRGARFAGAAAAAEPAAAPVEAVDAEAETAVAGVVERLAWLRGEGRGGEAHVLLVEVAQWAPGRFPSLADALYRAGLGADWATLLWEAASLPAERLVGVADALTAAGRVADGTQLLRQGVARPAEEIGAAVLRLAEEGRRREAEALVDACVRGRAAEEAARCAVPDPRRLVPLLLRAAQAVSDERHWDLVHALRVAGHMM
ncbi:hypothetical protein AB0L75_01530 [Streptomyces sp. NPDC052101]|uniref:hypothetical protein n=1 Tax=Streptomyces sp. NPDC052101 TaxID=3155763 RepID=UPI00341D5D61